MKISILTPDLSHNCLGRAYLLAKILQRQYPVEIVGPLFGAQIWPPLAQEKGIKYQSVKINGKLEPYWQLKNLSQKISGDIIYVSKPLFTSYGLGLLQKFKRGKPLILDIDDWELGFVQESYRSLSFWRRLKRLVYSALYPFGLDSYWNRYFFEKMASLANEVTVSNRFLKDRFGGTIIYHSRDQKLFNPERFNHHLIRSKYGLGKDKKVVMFLGSHAPHKGIEDLIEAIYRLKDENVLLVLVGLERNNYSRKLKIIGRRKLKKRVLFFGIQPFQKVPEFLAVANVVVIPQRKNLATIGQMPAKVFDAMAMAKPIIATAVSDLPEILHNCGWIVEPGNPQQLAKTIQQVFSHPREAEQKALRAKEKFSKEYSFDVMEKKLITIMRKYER